MIKTIIVSGKVDIGKTTLIKELTGQEMMKYSSEIKQKITIKVNSAKFEYQGQSFNIIDVPGHRNLLSNSIVNFYFADILLHLVSPLDTDLSVLIEAAKLSKHYGNKLVILQNKVDLSGRENCLKSHERIVSSLSKEGFSDPLEIIPISIKKGWNISYLKDVLKDIRIPPKPKINFANVIRSYDLNRPGVEFKSLKGGGLGVFNWNLELKGGEGPYYLVSRNQIYPLKVRKILCGGEEVETSHENEIQTLETSLPPFLTQKDIQRGSLIFKDMPVKTISRDVKILLGEVLEPLIEGKKGILAIGNFLSVGSLNSVNPKSLIFKLKNETLNVFFKSSRKSLLLVEKEGRWVLGAIVKSLEDIR